jgi:hypothetical protein
LYQIKKPASAGFLLINKYTIMANPPPPYDNITGISRTVMKDNAQETLAGYDGNARPGEIVADLTTDPPALYVGNNLGQLTAIASGGGGSTGNITFTNTTMSPPDGIDLFITAANSEVEITGLDFRVEVTDDVRIQGNDIVSIRNTSNVESIDIRTDYNGNDYAWEFDVTGNLTTPGAVSVAGDITVSGDITGTSSASTLVLKAQPASNTAIQLNNSVDSTISTVANLEIRTNVANTAQTWTFDTNGGLAAPGNISAGNILLSARITCQSVVTDPVNLGSLTAVFGARAFILDGNLAAAGNFGAQVAGGGGNSVPVWSDGTNWYIG